MIKRISLGQIKNKRNLRGSIFEKLYKNLILGEQISEEEFEKLLEIGLVFMNAGDDAVQELGYRIILLYSISYKDYRPLYEVARAKEYMPIVEILDSQEFLGERFDDKNIVEIIDDAYRSMFRRDGIVLSAGQVKLRRRVGKSESIIVVAPTSYGKSEMLILRAAKAAQYGNVCIVVPTKALIAQTFNKVLKHAQEMGINCKVIAHPDAYTINRRFIAVLTQERLLRLLVDNPRLSFQEILIDEAHGVFSNQYRSILLSSTILIAKSRNRQAKVSYFTPFLENPEQLRHINNVDIGLTSALTRESLKTERYYYGEPGGSLKIYDQYLNMHLDTERPIEGSIEDIVLKHSKLRTLVYLNRPRDVETFARRLTSKRSYAGEDSRLEKIAKALADFIHPEFSLVRCVRHGVFYHHGKLPDGVRQYIESVFQHSDEPNPLVIVSTSTLLEGVNLSPDVLIVLDPRRGRQNLSRSDFKNLAGRVSRFNTIFDGNTPRPDLLSPEIFVIKSEYSLARLSLRNFVQDRTNIALSSAERVSNPLLEDYADSRDDAVEVVENIESGASGSHSHGVRLATTEIGLMCFKRGVSEFDIFSYEHQMQSVVDQLRDDGVKIGDASTCFKILNSVFFSICTFDKREHFLSNLSDNPRALQYHAMHLEWKVSGLPLKTLVSETVAYWRKQEGLVYVSSRWGDTTRSGDSVASYIIPAEKTTSDLVGLAVVRLKEEREFISYKVCKFVEILYDVGLVESGFMLQVRFGTADPESIVLMRNGVSPDLVNILLDRRFRRFISIDVAENEFSIDMEILNEADIRDVNDILLTELKSLVSVHLE
ncbi:MAG: DEAD/DEAH box helicase [Corynebacterium amycolatum]|nr:DEAD/DEAH box helicase [Corynebacterium amycolatum]MDK8506056.1 DEAD/DEAH box helicase [Corynebacterium amycolatum]